MDTLLPIIFKYIIPFFILFTGIYLGIKTNLLKDQCNCEIKPYSFSRTQLLWWTLIISCCLSIYYGTNKSNVSLEDNYSLLILLGISFGTSGVARIIDNTDINNKMIRHQENATGKGFFTNILSDNNGISVHRFQALVFNIIFGLIFVFSFVLNGCSHFIQFDNLQLALMGVSSATYLGVKMNENSLPAS